MPYSFALMKATYINGRLPKRTLAHEKAEFHRFKSQHLFKNKVIPKDLYLARLIQFYVIIHSIEKKLHAIENDKTILSPFFELAYLDKLWRIDAIESDLRQLGTTPCEISPNHVTPTTRRYVKELVSAPPKVLLAHYLVHLAGFMHGGRIIQKKYIEPSNQLTTDTITANLYDFSDAAAYLTEPNKRTALSLYQDMMQQIDNIPIDECSEQIEKECTKVYAVMHCIYDDLCDMHVQQPKPLGPLLARVSLSLAILAMLLSYLLHASNPEGPSASFMP